MVHGLYYDNKNMQCLRNKKFCTMKLLWTLKLSGWVRIIKKEKKRRE